MTPTEDREIVEALAVNVMGWHSDRATVAWWFDKAGRGVCGVAEWSPLTSAADSKALRDRLAELGHDVALFSYRHWKLRGYDAEFRCTAPSPKTFAGNEAWADTEFRAVALCALQAVGVEL